MKNATVDQLLALVRIGSDTDVKKFVSDHWAEFPEDIQSSLAVSMMTDAAATAATKMR